MFMGFEDEIAIVLSAKKPDTDMINVVQALNYDQSKIQQAFDIALAMENLNLVKLLYSNFNAGKIVVELTLPGKAESKKLKP
jgi:hypothetical protein